MKVWQILVRQGGWRIVASTLAGLAGGGALAAIMRLVHQALTRPATELPAALLEFCLLLAVYFAGTVAAEHLLNDTGERLQSEWRQSLLWQILHAPLRQTERLGLSRLFNLLATDVRTVSEYVCWLPDAVVNGAVVVGCFAYLAWLSPLVFAFNLLFVGLAVGCYLIPSRVSERAARRAGEAWDRHVGHLQFALQGTRGLVLNSRRRIDFIGRHFGPGANEVRIQNRQRRLIRALTQRFGEALVLVNLACVLFVLPRFLDLSTALLTGLLLPVVFARAPLNSLLDVFPRTSEVRVAVERLAAAGLNVSAPLPDAPATGAADQPGFRELTFEAVTFRYEADHEQSGFASGPFNLRIRAGETVFIVGGNGSGKTTLGKLLCGLYPPAAGRIALDGRPVDDEPSRADLRTRFSAVFPGDPLFHHVLGRTPEEAEKWGRPWLRELRLDRKVTLRGTEFSTTDLSQGQRRRLVLLGAMLEDRPVLLLDEWAADQDPEFRVFFYDHIVPELKVRGKTLILITHDERYFDRADRVLRLDSGHLFEPPARG